MISKMEINGVHYDVSDKLRKYVHKKIGQTDRYIPKHARESAHAEVKLKEATLDHKQQYTCEVILHLPHDTITIKETTINMYAAVDIVETKLKNLLKKYKEKHASRRLHQRLLAKLRSRSM